MAILRLYQELLQVATERFKDIVDEGKIFFTESGEPLKLRLNVIDGSFIDVFYSARGRYSFHWERREINGTFYRYDNAPHPRWKDIKTFPRHFHDGSEENCKESYLSDDPIAAMEEILKFMKSKLGQRI